MPLHVERAGDHGPTVVLVHGSGPPGWGAWEPVRPLADRFRLVVPHRSGYPPNPPLARIDFEIQADEIAELIEPGAHLVGHSYGGVVSLLAAARAIGRVRSLTVIEPPAFGVARGNAAVEELITTLHTIAATVPEPRARLAAFLGAVGSTAKVPDPLPPAGEALVRAGDAERPPEEANLDFATIRGAGLPVLVISGGHMEAFEVVADAIARELDAARAILPGAGHSVQRLGPAFNDRLAAFVDAAEAGTSGAPGGDRVDH